jgi:hypothetical protein
MARDSIQRHAHNLEEPLMQWLLDSDPAIRWQVLRDLTGEPGDVVQTERSRVAVEGWGARLLEQQAPDGQWGGGIYNPKWISTLFTLWQLRELGVDPANEKVQAAISRVRNHVTWGKEFDDAPFFEGETEPCINGRVLAIGAYFGQASEKLAGRLLDEQLDEGGWNCEAPQSVRASVDTTICVLEGLLEYETANGPSSAVTEARTRAQEYLLERRMFRRRTTGEVIDPSYTQLSHPVRWYDILWGLDYLRRAGVKPDGRAAEAVQLVESKRLPGGQWPREDPFPGETHFDMEGAAGEPSRWNTLRAQRVLDWFSGKDD